MMNARGINHGRLMQGCVVAFSVYMEYSLIGLMMSGKVQSGEFLYYKRSITQNQINMPCKGHIQISVYGWKPHNIYFLSATGQSINFSDYHPDL